MGVLRKVGIGAGIGLASAGAVGGAALAGTTDNDPIAGAAIGAVAGAAVLPAAKLGAKGVMPLAKGAINANYGLVKGALNVGASAVSTAPKALGAVASMVNGASNTGMMGTLASPVRRHIGAVGNFASKLVDFDSAASGLNKVKISGLGNTMLWGTTAVAGAKAAFGEYNRIKMGTSDGQVTRNTPRMPAYQINEQAGTTGDLVFALHNNRRG